KTKFYESNNQIKTKSPSSTFNNNGKRDKRRKTNICKKTDLYVFNERIKIEQSSSTSKINDRRDKYEKTNFYES
ncbi:14591_t:CDS:2, partial [Entrophospora sp. SA101]